MNTKTIDVHGEEAIIRLLAPLAQGAPGAFGLDDDCALMTPEPGTELVLKTDPVAEGVHFLADDAPEDIAWKALAVNVSDLAAKAARPLGYLMALSFPEAPTAAWLTRFAAGLQAAQASFGCHLLGGDTDRRPGPLTISISIVGAVAGRPHGAARHGAAGRRPVRLGQRSATPHSGWRCARTRRWPPLGSRAEPRPRICATATCAHSRGLPSPPALRAHAVRRNGSCPTGSPRTWRACARRAVVAARVRLADVPVSAAAAKAIAADPALGERIVTGGDDYEVLAAVPAAGADAFRSMAAQAGIAVTRIGTTLAGTGIVIEDRDGQPLTLDHPGWDHF